MSNYQAEPRPLFNERRSRVFVVKDEIPDLTQLSIDSSMDLDKSSRMERSANFLSPSTPPPNKMFIGKKSIILQNFPSKRNSANKPANFNFEPTFVYDGIEDKVFIRK